MKKVVFILSMILLCREGYAKPPRKLSTYDEMTYTVSASALWKIVGDFNGLDTWHPAVKESEIISGENNKIGAIRMLTLDNGGQLHEKLLTYNSKRMSMSYDIHKGEYPAVNYVGMLKVIPLEKNKSKIVWTATLQRKDPNPQPKEGLESLKKIVQEPLFYHSEKDFIIKYAEI